MQEEPACPASAGCSAAVRKRWHFGQAIREECRDVWKFWGRDWFGVSDLKAAPGTVASATLYMFSYSFLTSASFGFLYTRELGGEWSAAVSFASGGLTGVFMALFGGQPVVLYGQTGPIVLLYGYVHIAARIMGVPFGPWVAWIGVWAFVMHALLAVFAVNDYKNCVTRFTAEIFEVLVASDYITSAVVGILAAFSGVAYNCTGHAARCSLNGFSTLFLALAFFGSALKFSTLHETARCSSARLLRRTARFSALVSLALWTVMSFLPAWSSAPGWPSSGVPDRVVVPAWGQTGHDFLAFLRMGEVPAWAVGMAVVPAFLLTVLFYVDQNLSTMSAVAGLRSPEAFNLDFLLLGLTVLITGLLGMPASSGLIPQNPMHTRSLRMSGGAAADSEGPPRFAEQRFSGLLHSVLLFGLTFLMPVVGLIPAGVLWGAFLLLASEAYNAEFVQRCLLLITSKALKHSSGLWADMAHILEPVPFHSTVAYTLLQLVCFLVLYVLAVLLKVLFPIDDGHTWVTVGITFPVLVCLCAIPVRSHLLPRLFSADSLQALDGGEAELQEPAAPLDGDCAAAQSLGPHQLQRAATFESRVRHEVDEVQPSGACVAKV